MDSIEVLEYYGVIDEYTNFSPTLNVKMSCPFHDETVESLNFDLKNDIFFCFGCGAKGDIVDFVKKIEGVNELQAMIKINKIVTGDEKIKEEILEMLKQTEKTKQELLDKAFKYYDELSDEVDEEAMQYLLDRGFTKNIINKFGLKFNQHSQYPIIIPIFDNGVFKGYIQRRLNNKFTKYLYNKGFQRKTTIVGNVEKTSPVLVVEGIFDMMKACQFGYKNVVSILGWKASEYQLEKISEANIIISGLDNDRAGKDGTKYLKKECKNVISFPYNDVGRKISDIDDLHKDEFRKSINMIFDYLNSK